MNQVATQSNAMNWSDQQLHDIKSAIFKGATDSELRIFAGLCKEKGLNPFAKQIYAMKYNSKQGPVVTYIVAIDSLRATAQKTGEYVGQDGPYWCGEDGQWKDVWLKKEPPTACKMGVLRKGFTQPLYAVALFDEFKQERNPLWRKLPTIMIQKCAESQALRRAFPSELGGLYANEEMEQAQEETKEEIRNRVGLASNRTNEAPEQTPSQIKIHAITQKIMEMDNESKQKVMEMFKLVNRDDLIDKDEDELDSILNVIAEIQK